MGIKFIWAVYSVFLTNTVINMPAHGLSLTCIFLYKDIIFDSVLVWNNIGQRKPVFWYILATDTVNHNGSSHY